MGFLKSLLKPKNAARALVDPAGATVSAATGSSGWQSWVDPSGAILKADGSSATPETASSAAAAAPDVSGDPSDPAYGSFAKPFTVEDFYDYADPGYAFQLQQGTQGLLNSAGIGGSALGGAALKDLLKYNQDYAGTAYNDAFNRYQAQQGNIFSRLYQLTSLGQNAAAGVGNQGTTLAGNAGQAISNAGSAAGAGIVGAGNSLGSGLTDYWLYKNFMNRPVSAAPTTGGV